jgi:hypothetical protein
MIRVTNARTARLLAAAGAASAVFAMIGAPTALADSSDLACSNGDVAMDGTCVPPTTMDTTSDALTLPNGTANDVVPSPDFSQGPADLSQGSGDFGQPGGLENGR